MADSGAASSPTTSAVPAIVAASLLVVWFCLLAGCILNPGPGPTTSPSPSTSSSSDPVPIPTDGPSGPKPVLDKIVPANGGVGSQVLFSGSRFGATDSLPIRIRFAGAFATDFQRLDDHTISVVVPVNAVSGNVLLQVGGRLSDPVSFFVVNSLALTPGNSDLLVGQGLDYLAQGTDTGGAIVSTPSVTWALQQGNSVKITKTDGSSVSVVAVAPGDTLISASCGNALQAARIHVFSISRVDLQPSSTSIYALPADGSSPDPEFAASNSITLDGRVLATDRLDRKLTWSSSDPSIASVQDGLVQAKTSTGSVTITATAVDDPTAYATAAVDVIARFDAVVTIH